ncbi:hypothetical protein BJ742DRAFT_798248 [Cladochytrium replicatum]|nr:hypothetical protein BJ742DRAFT_798248 [Cladochytrium replicatum]
MHSPTSPSVQTRYRSLSPTSHQSGPELIHPRRLRRHTDSDQFLDLDDIGIPARTPTSNNTDRPLNNASGIEESAKDSMVITCDGPDTDTRQLEKAREKLAEITLLWGLGEESMGVKSQARQLEDGGMSAGDVSLSRNENVLDGSALENSRSEMLKPVVELLDQIVEQEILQQRELWVQIEWIKNENERSCIVLGKDPGFFFAPIFGHACAPGDLESQKLTLVATLKLRHVLASLEQLRIDLQKATDKRKEALQSLLKSAIELRNLLDDHNDVNFSLNLDEEDYSESRIQKCTQYIQDLELERDTRCLKLSQMIVELRLLRWQLGGWTTVSRFLEMLDSGYSVSSGDDETQLEEMLEAIFCLVNENFGEASSAASKFLQLPNIAIATAAGLDHSNILQYLPASPLKRSVMRSKSISSIPRRPHTTNGPETTPRRAGMLQGTSFSSPEGDRVRTHGADVGTPNRCQGAGEISITRRSESSLNMETEYVQRLLTDHSGELDALSQKIAEYLAPTKTCIDLLTRKLVVMHAYREFQLRKLQKTVQEVQMFRKQLQQIRLTSDKGIEYLKDTDLPPDLSRLDEYLHLRNKLQGLWKINMEARVNDLLKELQRLWTEEETGLEEQKLFLDDINDNLYSPMSVQKLESEIDVMNERKMRRRVILDQLQERTAFIRDIIDFEKSAKDPRRLFRSSFQLVEEEKFRKTCFPTLLKIEEGLKKSISSYETETGKQLIVDGNRVLDVLTKEIADRFINSAVFHIDEYRLPGSPQQLDAFAPSQAAGRSPNPCQSPTKRPASRQRRTSSGALNRRPASIHEIARAAEGTKPATSANESSGRTTPVFKRLDAASAFHNGRPKGADSSQDPSGAGTSTSNLLPGGGGKTVRTCKSTSTIAVGSAMTNGGNAVARRSTSRSNLQAKSASDESNTTPTTPDRMIRNSSTAGL